MPATRLDRVELTVPLENGHLVGNTLRQYAMRGTRTWRVAAYRVAPKTGSFGLGNGINFSYYELLKGVFVGSNVSSTESEVLLRFDLQGKDYVCKDLVIKNLDKLGVPAIDVCLVAAVGARTANQNYEVVKRLCPQDVKNFVPVSSRHTDTITFRYEVKPLDQNSETLVIEATPGVLAVAKASAIDSLSKLAI